MGDFAQMLAAGTALGCVYVLVALGFVLIYKATEVVNFAQGELMMLGAFIGYTLIVVLGLPFWIGLAGAVVGMAAIGALLDRVVVRPIVGQPVFAIVIVTIGIGYVVRSVVAFIPGWGVDTHALTSPFSGRVAALGPLIVSYDQIAVMTTTVLLVGALFAFFRGTRLGIAMQAASQNQLAAYYAGIPVPRIFSLIWALSAAVSAVAGVLLAPIAFVHVNMGFIGLKAFPAAVLGGFGSIPGAIVGGLVIGIVESLAGFYLPEGFKDVAAYVVLLAVLAVRPQGLFVESSRKKV
ncbi:MAG: branched-chain amino acid ABC transporter permease [Ideonella sp.]|nr:branched-chain amino acid ABC transporter permease [Ideonella sp.]